MLATKRNRLSILSCDEKRFEAALDEYRKQFESMHFVLTRLCPQLAPLASSKRDLLNRGIAISFRMLGARPTFINANLDGYPQPIRNRSLANSPSLNMGQCRSFR